MFLAYDTYFWWCKYSGMITSESVIVLLLEVVDAFGSVLFFCGLLEFLVPGTTLCLRFFSSRSFTLWVST